MGAPPPTRMAPMHTCTEERRLMLMGVQCYDTQARIGLSGESPAQAGTPKAQIPPGNAQAQERQTAEGATSAGLLERDRKSTRLNSSHDQISYAVFCLKKKKVDCLVSLWDRSPLS